MRFLVLNWRDIRSPEAGGSELHLHEIFRRLVSLGHEVTLICTQFAAAPGPSEEVVDGIRTIRVGAWWNAHISVPRAAKRLMRAEPFDLLVDDVNKIPFFAPTWSRIPVLAIFHHLLGRTVFLETNPLLASMIWLYERRVGRVYRDTPAITVSPSTYRDLVAAGIRKGTLAVVPNGLDTRIYRQTATPKDEVPTLVVVARLKAYKRTDIAIRTLAIVREQVPAARMIVIGEGDERARIERLARALNQPVTFLGHVLDPEKVSWLNRAHVVLCPSEKEGFGLVALEAMACGTPVVASDVAGHRDVVPDGVGLRVPVRDPAAMAEAVVRVLTAPDLRSELTRQALKFASGFSWDGAAKAVERKALAVAVPARGDQLWVPKPRILVEGAQSTA
jgi:glycosyltransferase involved in cell wall biosynthesis